MTRFSPALSVVPLWIGLVASLAAMGCTSDPAASACRTVLNCKDDSVPICDAASLSCRACKAGADDTGCKNRNAMTPVCGPAGRCVACIKSSDCKDLRTASCVNNTCVGCQTATDCPSRVCNADGSCASPSDVIFVDSKNGTCTGTGHSGAVDDPHCTIPEAVAAAAASGKSLISVAPSLVVYEPVSITTVGAAGLRLSGSGSGTSLVQIRATNTAAVSIMSAAGSKVVLSGFDLAASNGNSIECAGGAELTVTASRIHHSANGIATRGCTVILDSLRIYKNDFNGLSLTNNSVYTLNNLMIWYNGASGITLSSSTGMLRFSTIFGNGGVGLNQPPGINCGATNNLVENSIVYRNNSQLGYGQQISGCNTSGVVTDDMTAASYGGIYKQTIDFVNASGLDASMFDLRLKPDSAANADCCIDKIAQASGLTNHDIDNNVRPKGAGFDIGASEAR